MMMFLAGMIAGLLAGAIIVSVLTFLILNSMKVLQKKHDRLVSTVLSHYIDIENEEDGDSSSARAVAFREKYADDHEVARLLKTSDKVRQKIRSGEFN